MGGQDRSCIAGGNRQIPPGLARCHDLRDHDRLDASGIRILRMIAYCLRILYHPWRLMLTINGRFLTQRMTGVQRYAHEMLRALDGILAARAAGSAIKADLLVPQEAPESLPSLRAIGIRRVGRLHGHPWEQLELPRFSQGILLNWCNTFPVALSRQMVVLHDASVHACPEGYTMAFRAYYRGLFAVAARRATMKIATDSQFSAAELHRFAGIPCSRITVIPCGADHWRNVVPDSTILDRLALRHTPYLMAVGSENRNKNIARLVAAFGRLSPSGTRLVLAGGSNPKVFANMAASDADWLIRTGRLTDGELASLYSHARAFVFPSLYEGFGLPPLEAMMSGCPVVCSREASLPEVVGEAALYCEARDVDDIALRLKQILEDSALRERLIAAGTQQVRRYTWRDSAEKMLALAQAGMP